jgi:hypothetical protein
MEPEATFSSETLIIHTGVTTTRLATSRMRVAQVPCKNDILVVRMNTKMTAGF